MDGYAKRIFFLVIQVQQLKHFASKSLTQLFYNIPILQLHCALKFMLFFSGDDFTYCAISHALHAYHLIYLFYQFLRLCNKTFFFPVDADVFFQAWSSLCSDLFLEKTFLQCFIPLSQLHFCLWMQLFLFVNFGASYYSRSIAKDCLLTVQEQACSRITCLFGCHHAENGPILRKMAIDCPLVITSIVDQTRKEE